MVRGGKIFWPPRSPYLIPLDFFGGGGLRKGQNILPKSDVATAVITKNIGSYSCICEKYVRDDVGRAELQVGFMQIYRRSSYRSNTHGIKEIITFIY
jgi:hypothetical protein